MIRQATGHHRCLETEVDRERHSVLSVLSAPVYFAYCSSVTKALPRRIEVAREPFKAFLFGNRDETRGTCTFPAQTKHSRLPRSTRLFQGPPL